jgi:divalent metal cation (Fe/Co/Zn/Cd) transporter
VTAAVARRIAALRGERNTDRCLSWGREHRRGRSPRLSRLPARGPQGEVALLGKSRLHALEGAVAVVAGIVAGSIALIGFGIDSAIEGFASVIIVWRFTGWRTLSHEAEERAQKLVAVQFFILAPYVGIESVRALIEGHHPEESVVGIALAASSLVAMPWLGWAKQRIAARIGSSATASEGKQNLLCAYLAGALLVGLLGNALLGAWWLDAVVGLLIAALAIQEGREAWQGDACTH